MKVYLVQGKVDMEVTMFNSVETYSIYGIFSTMDKAEEIAKKLKDNIADHNEREEITIAEMTIDAVTEDLEFMMHT